MTGIDIYKENLDLSYCKGRYYRLNNRANYEINNLIYPIPMENYAGLGVHVTLDLANQIKLGPDTFYIERDNLNYNVEDVKEQFYEATEKYIKNISIAIYPPTNQE